MIHLFPDISNNEPVIDGLAAKQQGMSAIAFKASEGQHFVDDKAAGNCDQARRNGLPVMAYHFMDSGDGAAQAAHFIACVDRACGGLAGVALNIDREGGGPADVDAFVREVRTLAPHNTFSAYSAKWANDQFGQAGMLATLPLWWSNYVGGAGDPHALLAKVTPGWFEPFGGFGTYASRQFTDSASIGGIGACDCSVCFDDASFTALFGGSAPAPNLPPTRPKEHDMFTTSAQVPALNAPEPELSLPIPPVGGGQWGWGKGGIRVVATEQPVALRVFCQGPQGWYGCPNTHDGLVTVPVGQAWGADLLAGCDGITVRRTDPASTPAAAPCGVSVMVLGPAG